MTGRIEEYFKKIMETQSPTVANNTWLKSIGFTSSNDRYLLRVLKYIGFIESGGTPSETWKEYRVPPKSKIVLARAIKKGYSNLFAIYPDAYRKDKEALYAYFSSQSNVAEKTITLMVNTFIALRDLADFEAPELKEITKPQEISEPEHIEKLVKAKRATELHINIQLHLPATDDSNVYDKLFESLKKHLLSDED